LKMNSGFGQNYKLDFSKYLKNIFIFYFLCIYDK